MLKVDPGDTVSSRRPTPQFVPTFGGVVPTSSQPKLLIVPNVPTSQRGLIFSVLVLLETFSRGQRLGRLGHSLVLYTFSLSGGWDKKVKGWDKVGTLGMEVGTDG